MANTDGHDNLMISFALEQEDTVPYHIIFQQVRRAIDAPGRRLSWAIALSPDWPLRSVPALIQ